MEEIEQQIYKKLEELGVSYDVYHHEPIGTIAAAEDLDQETDIEMCKNLFLSTKHKSEYYLLFMMGHKKFRTGPVSREVGVPRMTFGDDEAMWDFLSIRPGSVSPLGLLYDTEKRVQLLIDSDVMKMERVTLHPCVNTSTVVVSLMDLLEKVLPACEHTYRVVTVEE